MTMSKLERLNTRVEKLLVKAVQEVLEVVKETVSEYREKTARTQRENQSLKRRLQELQERINSQSNEIPLTCDTQQNNMKQDLKLIPSEEDTAVTGPQHPFEDTACKAPIASLLLPCLSLNSQMKHLGSDDQHNTRTRNTDISNGSAAVSEPVDQIFTPDSMKVEPPSDEDGMNNTNDLYCDPATGSTSLRRHETAQTSSGLYKELSVVFSMNQNGVRESLSQIYSNTNISVAEEQQTDAKACGSGSVGVQRKVRKHYSCSLCGRVFRHAGDFKKHNRVHTGEKPYCCLVCGKRFGQSGYLTVHLRCHTGEKPFGCSHCGKSFSHSSNMKKHVTRCDRRDWG